MHDDALDPVRLPDGGSAASPEPLRLPVPPTDLIGRDQDVEAVAGLLSSRRVVTLVGPPGIGKTRLAIAVAEEVAHRFYDGVVFVPLAEAAGTDRVIATVAAALGVTETADQPLIDSIATQIAAQHLLLVLDNLEQALDAAPLIGTLVGAGHDVTALVTSRERLRISGEQVYVVPPLTLPELTLASARDQGAALLLLATSSAVELFVARAAEAAPDFALDATTMQPVAELCHRLDGLPLAIELAAARVTTFTPDEVLGDLSQRLDLISHGPRDLPARQQTLHAAIEWSFTLLAEDEQALLARLSVFAGGCLAETAHAVCAPQETKSRVAQLLAALSDKNLVQARPDPEGRTHYVLLETIRVFAAERLTLRGEAEQLRARHSDYYADFASRANTELTGADQAAWLGRVDREYHNLQAALAWAYDNGCTETAASIAADLERFWWNGLDISGGRRWYDRILALPGQVSGVLRVRVLLGAAQLACLQDEFDQTHTLAGYGLTESRALGDWKNTARALNLLALAAERAGNYGLAQIQYDESLTLCRDMGDKRGTAVALGNLGEMALRLDDLDIAASRLTEGLQLFREIGDSGGYLICMENLGSVRLWQGDSTAARSLLSQALTLSREVGDKFPEAAALDALGRLAGFDGRPAEARRLCADGLEMRRDIGEQETIAESLQTMAGLALIDAPAFAVYLLAAAAALRERLNLPLPPIWQPSLEIHLAHLRSTLDDEMFAAAWTRGSTEPIESTIAQALTWAR